MAFNLITAVYTMLGLS